MEELDQLATTINFAIARIKQGGGAPGDIAVDDDEGIERAFVKTVEEFDGATGDALLLLDRDKRVRFIGKATEELLNMRTQYALGQNISDACKDPGFAGTAIDLCERVLNTLGEAQHVMLDINGIARNMSAVGHRDAQGNIRFILVVVKLGGGA
jgi:transcriptional regulator with PAS, ATPase and Fis domain